MKRLFHVSLLWLVLLSAAGATEGGVTQEFPRGLASYADNPAAGVMEVIKARAQAEPFNLVATGIFLLAVLHTFATSRILHWAHRVEEKHARKLERESTPGDRDNDGRPDEVSFLGQI